MISVVQDLMGASMCMLTQAEVYTQILRMPYTTGRLSVCGMERLWDRRQITHACQPRVCEYESNQIMCVHASSPLVCLYTIHIYTFCINCTFIFQSVSSPFWRGLCLPFFVWKSKTKKKVEGERVLSHYAFYSIQGVNSVEYFSFTIFI